MNYSTAVLLLLVFCNINNLYSFWGFSIIVSDIMMVYVCFIEYLILVCHLQLLINNLADNCYKVAIDRSGCCVLQICMEKSKGQPRQRLVSEIVANAVHLSRDPYGFVLSTTWEVLYFSLSDVLN